MDELAVPADSTTTTEAPATTTADAPEAEEVSKALIEGAFNQFSDSLNNGDIAGAYALMAPQHRDQWTLEQALAFDVPPTGQNEAFQLTLPSGDWTDPKTGRKHSWRSQPIRARVAPSAPESSSASD